MVETRKGGRPNKLGETAKIEMLLSKRTIERLDEISIQTHRSRSSLLREAVDKLINANGTETDEKQV